MAFPTAQEFIENNFDYLVVGGGTAGLVVAARLSEDPNVTVGVLEAGGYFPDHPLITVPGYFARSLGNPDFDWAFLTAPQEHANGRPIFHPRGKVLGGSSALNFMATGRASKEEYDAFESLGNDGWNWSEFLKYMKKSETTVESDPDFAKTYNAKISEDIHGTSGPIYKSHNTWSSGLTVPFFDSLQSRGVQRNPDAANGSNTGSYTILSTVDPKTSTRSYAASGYYEPNASRPNLVVLLGAQVTKVVLEGEAEPYVAKGVEFVHAGEKYTAYATKEVVISAGSFQTPQLLELSGIGSPKVLGQASIPVKVDLPGVGDNLQDHIYVASTIEVSPDLETLDVLRDEERSAAEEINYQSQKGLLAGTHSAYAFLPLRSFTEEDEVTRLKNELKSTTILSTTTGFQKQHALLQEWFDDERHAQIELITYPGFFPAPGKTPKPGSHYHTVLVALMHPVSRGTVHIQSSDPLEKPIVDPAYLSSTVDLDLLVNAVKFVNKLHETEPLKSVTLDYVEPAWGDDEELDDEDIREYVKNGFEPVYHPAGTAAMLPREDGGVVDSRLKVYGTTNLRIVDASIFPFHLSAHPQSTIYGMAEKLSDLVKEDAKLAIIVSNDILSATAPVIEEVEPQTPRVATAEIEVSVPVIKVELVDAQNHDVAKTASAGVVEEVEDEAVGVSFNVS